MAQRLWTPADMVGVTGHEYTDSTKGVTTVDGTFVAGTFVTRENYQLIGAGTPDYISAFRDDFRPSIDFVNGYQVIRYDTATRQMDISKTNLPQGDGDKFWWSVDFIDETRTDDRYTWGYGGSNGSSVSYKMRQGAVPYSDIGSVGYQIGTVAVKANELSIITEQYTKADTTSKASYNGNPWSSGYVRSRNTSISQAARYGHWAVYGNGCAHRHRFRGHGYGTPSDLDWQRLRGWASWNSGDNGASIAAGQPFKDAPPYIDDGTGSAATTPNSTYRQNVSTSPTMSARASAVPVNAYQDNVATSPTVVPKTGTSPDSAYQDNVASSPVVGNARSVVVPASAYQDNVASSASAAARGSAQPDNAYQLHVASSPILTPRAVLLPASAYQDNYASSPVLSNVRSTVQPTNAYQDNVSTSPSMAVQGRLNIDSAYQINVVTPPVLLAKSTLQPASAYHENVATSPSVFAKSVIAPASTYRDNVATSPTISGKASVQPSSSYHLNVATSPTVSAKSVVYPASSFRLNVASSPSLTIQPKLQPDSTFRLNYATSPAVIIGPRPLPPIARTVYSRYSARVVYSPLNRRLAV